MLLTPFSIALIAIIVFLLIKEKKLSRIFEKLFILTIIVTLNIRMGYFVRFGESTLSYSSFLTYSLGMVALIILIKTRGNNRRRNASLLFLMFVCSLFIGLLTVWLFPYEKPVVVGDWTNYVLGKATFENISISSVQIGYYLMFFFYGIILIAAIKCLNGNQWENCVSTIISISKLNIIIGYIEWLIVNILHSKFVTDIFITIFGSYGAQQNSLVRRGSLFSIQGATKEASMYTTSIFYLCLLIIVYLYKKPNVKLKRWLILGMILLAINPAMSSYLYIAIIFGVIISLGLIKPRKRDKVFWIRNGVIVASVVLVITLIWTNSNQFLSSPYYSMQRLGKAVREMKSLFNNTAVTYSSEGIRFSGIIYDLQLFSKRPLFGVGLGAVSCNSGIVTFLVNAGAIGMISWILFIRSAANFAKDKKGVLLLVETLILPNIVLNDYETLLCMIIPIICITYEYSSKNITLINMIRNS